VSAAGDDGLRAERLLGVTWALTARAMNDPAYFEQCLASLPPPHRALLRLLPQRCLEARDAAAGYAEWRAVTKGRAASAYAESFGVGRR
jgi:hypothetical protein